MAIQSYLRFFVISNMPSVQTVDFFGLMFCLIRHHKVKKMVSVLLILYVQVCH